jgi:acetyl esterase
MTLDEPTARLVKMMIEARPKPTHEMTPDEARAYVESARPQQVDSLPMARVDDHELEVADGTIAVRVLVPVDKPKGVIVYLHGGGWVLGSAEMSDPFGRRLAQRTSCAVVLVDYRLAPEHPFPIPVDDAYEAVRWTDRHLTEIAGDRVPLIIAGDSAGGNLAAVAAIRARDRGEVAIALQVLSYPITDCDFETDSYRDPENALSLTRDTMRWFWNHYVPNEADQQHPDASPLRTPDLAGLPSAVIVTAEHDVLASEGESYARRLAQSGVEVRHRRFDGQMHGFLTMLDVLPASAEALDFIADQIDRRLGEESP